MNKKQKRPSIENMLKKLSPDMQAMAKDYARLKVENKMLQTALQSSEKNYAHLFAYILAILRNMPDYKISFKKEDFEAYQMFRESWQLKSEYNAETEEQILWLSEVKGKEEPPCSEDSESSVQ
jgi:hypothetical protein